MTSTLTKSFLVLAATSLGIAGAARFVAASMMSEPFVAHLDTMLWLFVFIGVVPIGLLGVTRNRAGAWVALALLTLAFGFSYLFTGGWSDRP